MKRRCVPLRADHDLLTPDIHTLSGVRLHPVIQVRSEGVASLSGYLSESASSQSAAGSLRRRLVTSPTRRLRFEDETETEAESRYLERQRKRGGQRGTGVLFSKPDLDLYVRGRAGAGLQGTEHVVDRHQRGQSGGVKLNLCPHPPVAEDRGRSLNRPHLNLRTEPIRETYIGSITPGETNGGGAGGRAGRRTNQVKLNGNQMTIPQTTPTTDLPINPYASDQLISTSPYFSSPPVTSPMMSQRQEKQKRPAAAEPHRELPTGAKMRERSPDVKEGLDPRGKKSSSSSSSSRRNSETTAESQAPPTSGSSSDGHVRQTMRAEVHSDVDSLPERLSRDEPSRLSLRRLFSNVRLSRTRTGSLDRHSSRPRPLVPDPAPSGSSLDRVSSRPSPLVPDLAPSGSRKSSGLLQNPPSVQSLSVVSPFFKLRKSWSVQNLLDQQKKKMEDRSCDYRPAADQLPQRCLSLEDVGRPSSVRSVGRVLQVCSDGTVLLEVSRPENQMYGFIISRRRGRDSGVYVEDMVDSSTEKLYAGLLAVGDEILEVNGKKVSGLSLDQVTHQLNQNISVTVRVLRHQQTPPR